MLPPVHPDAVVAGAAALRPVGNLGATFARDDAARVLAAAWPHLAADVLLWAADIAKAQGDDRDVDVVTWLRDLADRVSRPPAPGARH